MQEAEDDDGGYENVVPGPGQTGNVWRRNNIKQCLVTKQADVEVSGQTVKTAFDLT